MIADASMGKFADRLGTQLADNLLDAGFEKAAIEAVSKRRSFDPADFRQLLMERRFPLALAWVKNDRDEFQSIIVENIDYIFDNFFTATDIVIGLFFIRKLKNRNRSFDINQRFKAIAVSFMEKIPECANPMMVAVLWAELLHGHELRQIYIDAAVNIGNAITEASGNKHILDIFYDKDANGRWLISIIHEMGNTELIEIEGVKTLILRDWNGPYNTEIIPFHHSSIWHCINNQQCLLRKDFNLPPSNVSFLCSLKVWMMATYPKVTYTLAMDILCFILTVWYMTILFNDDDFFKWGTSSHSQQDDEKMPIPSKAKLLMYMILIYTGLLWIQDMFLITNAYLNHVKVPITNPRVWASVLIFAIALTWRFMYEQYPLPGHKMLEFMQYILIVFFLAYFIRILISLKSTNMYGPVVRNIELMVVEMIAFAIFLALVVVAFSAYIFVTKMNDFPWNMEMKGTVPYMWNAMLGNYNSGDWDSTVAGWQGLITFIIFQVFSSILLLNLIISFLSEIYERVNDEVTRHRLREQLVLNSFYAPHEKYTAITIKPAPLNIIVLPMMPLLFFERTLKMYNEIVIRCFYLLLLLPVCMVAIMALNLLLIIPAFFWVIAYYTRMGQGKNLLKWLALGMPRFMWFIVKDTLRFVLICAEPPSKDLLYKRKLFDVEEDEDDDDDNVTSLNKTHGQDDLATVGEGDLKGEKSTASQKSDTPEKLFFDVAVEVIDEIMKSHPKVFKN